ncbi:LysR family transcriptional regulator [Prodigiosinella aquatilis]|nr:LysR family transcriptional regulator [Prodigiosinella sp. LS101]WJV55605.1 LysR family transcriptional regulator [Prodigiosinella sp. LS101]WJV59966.1 LysR family transcriptional regulator [Pectobacteriaceae bacterium C111]
MEFRQLRYFLAVAETLHFTAAAEKIGIAQPPLSQQIQKLEHEIGTPLFIRNKRHVELTEAGIFFREKAQKIIAEAESALAQIKMVARGESGHLSIGFAGSIVFHGFVASAMREFRKIYPEVVIHSKESNSIDLMDKVRDAAIDCALVRLPLKIEHLNCVQLVDEPMIAVLPLGHQLAQNPEISLSDLADDSFITFPREIGPVLYDSIIRACQDAGFSPRLKMESPQISSSINLVAAGFGVAVIPESLKSIHSDGVTYHGLSQPLTTALGLIYREQEKSAVIRNFVRMMSQAGGS